MNNQEQAKKITDAKLTPLQKMVIFELVRAKNSILGRVAMGEYFTTYTIFNKPTIKSMDKYVTLIIKKLKEDEFNAVEVLTKTDKYTVIEISWNTSYIELDESVVPSKMA